MNLSQKKFYNIAHRGASAFCPENTMAAFRKAVEMKADMIELDVLLSKDNIPVVFHDEKLDSKTNGKGLLANHTFSELRALDAGSWFDSKFSNEIIPSLREVLEYTKNRMLVNIEIKAEAVSDSEEGGVEELVLNLVDELDMKDQVLISSFDYRVLDRIKKKKGTVKVAMLYNEKQSYGRDPLSLIKRYNVDAFNLSAKELSENWIKQLNDSKTPFFVYTVNKPVLMKRIIKSGAKGIFTDRPDVLNKVVSGLDLK